MQGWGIIWSFICRNRYSYFFGILSNALGNILIVFIPKVIGEFTDQLQIGNLTSYDIGKFASFIAGLGVTGILLMHIGRIITQQKGRKLQYEVRQKLFEKWLELPPMYYQRYSIGDLMSRVLSDIEVIRGPVTWGINLSTNAIFMLGTALYMMAFSVNGKLTIVSFIPLLSIPFIVRILGPKIKKQSKKSQEALSDMSKMVEENINGIRVVKSFANEDTATRCFEEKVTNIVTEKLQFIKLSSFLRSLMPLTGSLSFIIVFLYGGYLTIHHEITLGDFVSFTIYVAIIQGPLEQVGQVLNLIQSASASLVRLSELLMLGPFDKKRVGKINQDIKGSIKVHNLTFKYPESNRTVLKNISFTIKKGQTIGIIGGTGSGKSTLVKLLLRLYDAPKGTIFFDENDLLDYSIHQLRKSISYVPQDGFLFSMSIKENIFFADDAPHEKKVEKSLRESALYKDIHQFSSGLDTTIGEKGIRLSGGQKQRTAIARALYKDSPILIFDDSLSAVDAKTEHEIISNIRKCYKNKTVIIISNRLSTVQCADEIIVLDDGKIIEHGNHEKLMKKGSIYAEIYRKQSGEMEGIIL